MVFVKLYFNKKSKLKHNLLNSGKHWAVYIKMCVSIDMTTYIGYYIP